MNAGVAAGGIDNESAAGEAESSHVQQHSASVAPSNFDMDTSTPAIGGDSIMPVPGPASDGGHDELQVDVDMAEFSTLSRMGLNGSDSEDLGVDATLKEKMAAPASSVMNTTAPAVERAAPIPVSLVSDSSCIRANYRFCCSSAIHCKRGDYLPEVLAIDCSLDAFHTCGRNGRLALNHTRPAIALLLNIWVCVYLLLYIPILTPYPLIPDYPHISTL